MAIGDVACQVVAGQHYALAEAGGARGVVEQHYFFIAQVGIADVFASESLGIGLVHFLIDMFEEALDGFAVALVEAAEIVSENTPRKPLSRSSSRCSQMGSLVNRKTDSEWFTMWWTSLGWKS